jgi:protein-S-isoprenylcysteine O-methyltransferase Ste14
MLARVVIVVGALLVLISLFADQMGLGRSPGFGWRQTLGVVVGVLVILAGAYLWWREGLRGKVSQ